MKDGVYFWELEDLDAAEREMITRFPPLCRVIPTRQLSALVTGRVGRVVKYARVRDFGLLPLVQDEAVVMGQVRADTEGMQPAVCLPEWLLVVQYDGNKTPSWVRRTMRTKDPGTVESPASAGRIEGPRVRNPKLWVLRMDTGEPMALHPRQIGIDGQSLFIESGGQRIPAFYLYQLLMGEV